LREDAIGHIKRLVFRDDFFELRFDAGGINSIIIVSGVPGIPNSRASFTSNPFCRKNSTIAGGTFSSAKKLVIMLLSQRVRIRRRE
jgi:hypothetical protein